MQGQSLCDFLLSLLNWKLKGHSLIMNVLIYSLKRHNGKVVVFLTIEVINQIMNLNSYYLNHYYILDIYEKSQMASFGWTLILP